MIIVTGGAGFIGSNLVHGLNESGYGEIIIVDDLTEGHKFRNFANARILDYLDIDTFEQSITKNHEFPESIKVVFHQGACTTTTEWDGRYMMQNNYEYSKKILHYCSNRNIPLVYASSGSVYGTGKCFSEDIENEKPVNIYGYSKYLFDNYVRLNAEKISSQVTGLRYFNVYGPREQHKGGMASIIWHLNRQLARKGTVSLYKGCNGYENGEQRRDFVYVDDVVAVNLWFMQSGISGIFNVGTGKSRSFNDVANIVIAYHGNGEIEYIDFPENLRGCYQAFTEADLDRLKKAGFPCRFNSLETGVQQYLDWLGSTSTSNGSESD